MVLLTAMGRELWAKQAGAYPGVRGHALGTLRSRDPASSGPIVSWRW